MRLQAWKPRGLGKCGKLSPVLSFLFNFRWILKSLWTDCSGLRSPVCRVWRLTPDSFCGGLGVMGSNTPGSFSFWLTGCRPPPNRLSYWTFAVVKLVLSSWGKLFPSEVTDQLVTCVCGCVYFCQSADCLSISWSRTAVAGFESLPTCNPVMNTTPSMSRYEIQVMNMYSECISVSHKLLTANF